MDQTCHFPGVPRAAGTARVERIPWHAGGESHRGDHTRNRRLDANLSTDHAVDYTVTQAHLAVLADRIAKDVWPVCLFLRHAPSDDLRVARQVFQCARDVGRCGKAAVHYRGAYCVCINDRDGVDLDEGMDSADGWQALAGAAPAALVHRRGGRNPLHLAGESG